MSKRINVNPGNYKVAGRERQGEDVLQAVERQAYAEQRAEEARWVASQESAPGWETPQQPLAPDEPATPLPAAEPPKRSPGRTRRSGGGAGRRKPARRAKTAARTAAKKTGRGTGSRRTAAKRGGARKRARRATPRTRAGARKGGARKRAARRRTTRRR